MALTKLEAWTLFKADKLGQTEGRTAIEALTKEDFDAYEEFAEGCEFDLAKLGIDAQNEAAHLLEVHEATVSDLTAKGMPYEWVAEDYRKLVGIYEGSNHERLHLSAMFRFANNELLLELVKPS